MAKTTQSLTPVLEELLSLFRPPRNQHSQELYMKAQSLVGATASLAICLLQNAHAEQPPAPCHPNPNAPADSLTVRTRGDIAELPDPLKDRLAHLAARPHTVSRSKEFAEADNPGRPV